MIQPICDFKCTPPDADLYGVITINVNSDSQNTFNI